MPLKHAQALQVVDLDQILNRYPLVVGPETPTAEVVEYMSRTAGQTCHLPGSDESQTDVDTYLGCALVMADDRLLGIFTERDLVRLVADEAPLESLPIAQVMTQPVKTLNEADAGNIFTVLAALQRHGVRQLPVVDAAGAVLGVVTQTHVRQAIQPFQFLKLRQVSEAMTPTVLKANPTANLLDLARQMAQHRVSCIVIVEPVEAIEPAETAVPVRPVGIVTERDLVQFRALGLSLTGTPAQTVMSAPLFLVRPDESLWSVRQQMQRRRTRRLVVADEAGQLVGIITQTSLLAPLDPAILLAEVEQLQQVVGEQTNQLSQANQQLQKEVIERQHLEAALLRANQQLEAKIGRQAAQLVMTGDALSQEVQERHQAQQELAQFFVVTPSLLCIAGLDGYFKRLNPTFSEVLGYSQAELMAEPFISFVHPDDRLATQQVVEQLIAGGVTTAFENRYRCKDGTYRWLSWNATVLTENQLIYAAARDVTEAKQAATHLQRQSQQSQLLNRVTRKIRDSSDLAELLETAVAEAQDLLGCDRILILEANVEDPDACIVDLVAASSDASQSCVCTDMAQQACSLLSEAFRSECDIQASLEVKIYVQNQLWGLLVACHSASTYTWQPDEVELMQQLADHMGVAISQAQLLEDLESRVKQRTEQLQQEIQERSQTEAALRESEQRLSGILKNADEAIISINPDQQIVLFNQGAERIFGYTAAEVMGQPLDMLLPDAFRQSHRQHVRNYGKSKDASRQMAERNRDVFGQRKNGETFPAEASISKMMAHDGPVYTVMLKDITERRRSEAALQRSEEQLRLTANALPVLICYVDSDHRYRFNNQTYADWFHRPVDAFHRRPVWEVMGDEYYQLARPHLDAALAGQQVQYEVSLTSPSVPMDRPQRDLSVTYVPDVDETGEVRGCFGLISDISDRKANERIKNEFVSVVSHELRTPLTSIHGSLKLLSTGQLGALAPQGQDILEIALANTERLSRLINDVLDLERMESGRVSLVTQPCSLARLMHEAVQAMQRMADEQGVQLMVEPLDVNLQADPDHIVQTLTNLLSNAVKFSTAGTTVRLGAVERDADVEICVEDQGRGIPPDKLEQIFERFQQVDASDSRQRGGTGLGLAICKQIVEQHGGQIWAESIYGEGSRFCFTLPKGDRQQ
ncbi:MAG: PAS domain S-box protein [Cyanobacteria bacterium J06648_16]